jgi:uncharacterized membrane protein YqgA involved in biofilm formation
VQPQEPLLGVGHGLVRRYGPATVAGGVLIGGLGPMLLKLKEVRVANPIPTLVFAPLLVADAPLWPC